MLFFGIALNRWARSNANAIFHEFSKSFNSRLNYLFFEKPTVQLKKLIELLNFKISFFNVFFGFIFSFFLL